MITRINNIFNKEKYYHIVNDYTFKELGYNSSEDAPRDVKEKEFSKNNKKLGNKIELHDIKRDIAFIISSKEKLSAIMDGMGDVK